MKKFLLLLLLLTSTKVSAENLDTLTFAVLGNSISTYYDFIPSGYAIYYTADREKNYGIQVGDQWWMQLSRLSGLTYLTNASWSGSRVSCDLLNSNAPFLSNHRMKALGRAGVPDFVFIAGGTNDWNQSKVPLGSYRTENFTDSVSFRGAYQRLLWKLSTWYPQTKVVCLSILPRGDDVNKKNSQGWSQADANASIQYIANQFGQYYIDCTTIPFSTNWSLYMLPGNLHPTAEGFTIMAQHICQKMIQQGIITSDLKRSGEVEEAERLLDLSFTADGMVNNGTFEARIGKRGTAATVYDATNDTYYGCTKAKSTDYFYAIYDENTALTDAFNNSVTWEMLVRMDGEADQDGNISRACIMGSDEGNGGWVFYNTPLASSFSYWHKSGVKSSVKSITGDSILVAGKFYHLVVTMDRMSHIMRYFINGKLVCTSTRCGTDMAMPLCGTTRGKKGMWICLGGDASGGSFSNTAGAENATACSFVFARIYDGALSQNAAKNLYNDEVKKFTEQTQNELLLDLEFTPDGAVNQAPAYLAKPVEMVGEVPVAYNAEANVYEAQFSRDKTKFFKYFVGNEPSMMNQLSDAYSVEVYCRTDAAPAANTRPVSFVNGYGFGLQMTPRSNVGYTTTTQGRKTDDTYEKSQWTWVGEGVLTDAYTHYVIVYDRLNYRAQFYINGELFDTRWLTFKECPVYEWTPTTWLAIGGDAKGNYESTTTVGTYPFIGDLAMVRIYGGALTQSQVQTLAGMVQTQEKTYTLGTNGYVAVCLPYVWQVPEGCVAFIATEIASPNLTLTPIAQEGELVARATPVILKGNAKATVTLSAVTASEVPAAYLSPMWPENLLVGTYPGRTLEANVSPYLYYMKTTGSNIYRATSNVNLPAFSCYLPTTEKRTYFKLIEEDPTGIGEVNDNLNLNVNRGVYDLSGRRISTEDSSLFTLHSSLKRGIYIRGGKKVLGK